MKPERFLEGIEWGLFLSKVVGSPVSEVRRLAKNLLIMLDGQRMWHIHLSSTGWLKQIEVERNASDREFLHSTGEPSHRMGINLSDGQRWVYSDSRAWGRFYLRKGVNPEVDPYLSTFGPDWLIDPSTAGLTLALHRGNQKVKDILCDQKITSGLGNYLACEACHLAKLHPHQRWGLVDIDQRKLLIVAIHQVLKEAMTNQTIEHWRVFKKAGAECTRCKLDRISYVKDAGGQRGSYFCPRCQPHRADPRYD